MHLNHLSLTNFRNYARLELSLPDRLTVIQGANAQGKTNLLEAIHLLATGRSPRAAAERELINWLALEGPLPYARLVAEIGDGQAKRKAGTGAGVGAQRRATSGPTVRKQVRINGVPKRALDLVGRLRVVLFLPEDVSLVAGAPAERRRYLDIALCQIASSYCRALSEYRQVLAQRNALLRRLRDEGGDAGQLGFWDSADGRARQRADASAQPARSRSWTAWRPSATASSPAAPSGCNLTYLPSPDAERVALGAAPRPPTGSGRSPPTRPSRASRSPSWLLAQLRHRAPRIAAGATLLGPHRDDMAFAVDGHDLRAFGSRGQQRTAALALKLAEVQMMREETGDSAAVAAG